MIKFSQIRARIKQFFPSKEVQHARGIAFAKREVGEDPTEDQVDCFMDSLPLEPGHPFDEGIRDYLRSINWGIGK